MHEEAPPAQRSVVGADFLLSRPTSQSAGRYPGLAHSIRSPAECHMYTAATLEQGWRVAALSGCIAVASHLVLLQVFRSKRFPAAVRKDAAFAAHQVIATFYMVVVTAVGGAVYVKRERCSCCYSSSARALQLLLLMLPPLGTSTLRRPRRRPRAGCWRSARLAGGSQRCSSASSSCGISRAACSRRRCATPR